MVTLRLRGRLIGRTSAFGADYSGSSPGPGATLTIESAREATGAMNLQTQKRSGDSRARRSREAGMTLLELIVACAILLVLSSAATPLVRITIVRSREAELRRDLREMKNAIDRYKDMADTGAFRTEVTSNGYPPDLDTLVKGEIIAGNKRVRFLRRIPVDPMTGNTDWGLRSIQDDPDSTSWGGGNVFDVFSKSQGTALDGTKYSDW
jgi:general secretion pathway protein G